MSESPTLSRPEGMGPMAQPERRPAASSEMKQPPARQPGSAPPLPSTIPATRDAEQAHEAGAGNELQQSRALPVPTQPIATATEAQGRPSVGSARGDKGAARERAATFHEVSTSVLDETTDDPGVRFVLIACALFALFIVILIFSYILR